MYDFKIGDEVFITSYGCNNTDNSNCKNVILEATHPLDRVYTIKSINLDDKYMGSYTVNIENTVYSVKYIKLVISRELQEAREIIYKD